MPASGRIGKQAVIKHHRDVPYRLLEPVPDLGGGDGGSGNLIVHGDNLQALKTLVPRYAGQVKCVYIDPACDPSKAGPTTTASTARKSGSGWARSSASKAKPSTAID